jgi:hypothetical protein
MCHAYFYQIVYYVQLVGGLEYFLFSHILGTIIPFDEYFSRWLKPPTGTG